MADMSKAEKLAAARKKLKEFQQKSKDSPSGVKTTSRKNGGITKNVNNDVNSTRNFVFDSGPHEPADQGVGYTSAVTFQEPDPLSYESLDFVSPGPAYYDNNDLAPRRSTPDSNRSSGDVSLDQSSARDFFDHLPGQATQDWPSTRITQDYSAGLYESNAVAEFAATDNVHEFVATNNVAPPQMSGLIPTDDPVAPPQTVEFISTDNVSPPQMAEFFTPSNVSRPQTAEFITPSNVSPPQMSEFITPSNVSSPQMADFITPSNVSSPQMAEFITPGNEASQQVAEFVATNNVALPQVVGFITTDNAAPPQVADCVTTWSIARPPSEEFPDASTGRSLPLERADDGPPVSARSTSESIRQLSQQMTGLVGGAGQAAGGGADSELECRNQELAAMLDVERQAREQLQLQLKEYQAHVSRLSTQLESQRVDIESRSDREMSTLREQLQLHVQTVGILVAEKTELQSALTHCQAEARLRVSETEDLQGRLKASRYRVSELEKEVLASRTTLEKSEATRQLAASELDRLRLDRVTASTREREWEEERAELEHRLSARTDECSALGRELHEVRARLSLAQLRVEQLGSEDGRNAVEQMEALHLAKISVEQRVAELEGALKKSESEHDRSSQQFQQYVRGVETQVSELTEKVVSLEAEKHLLVGREQSLTAHMAELEKRIQLQDQHRPERLPTPDKKLTERLSRLEAEKTALSDELSSVTHRSGELEAGLHEREARIEELEAMVERMQGDQPDQGRLLAAMESDKVAAARAVSQNQRLKVELQELQDGFVTLSNCKLDLTDKLEHERHRSRQLEQQIDALRTRMEEHEHEHGHEHEHEHKHEHGHREAAESRARLDELSSQNDELRKLVSRLTAPQDQSPEGSESRETDIVASLSASVTQLESERNQLREQLSRLEGAERAETETTSAVTREAMDQLQEQFTRKMAEIADLSDEKQRLEHLVLQLQGETETIGEYITLYQKQRGLLRQRAEEKDNQLKCLAQDREEMRLKLAKLNDLIGRLVAEKSATAALEAQTELTNGGLLETERQVSEEVAPEGPNTAGKILALLSEIGTSNLVDPHHPVEHFHPCAWCSGRLITV